MIRRVLAAVAAVAALGLCKLGVAQAQTTHERSVIPTIGCYLMDDLEKIMDAGRIHGHHFDMFSLHTSLIMRRALATQACFSIPAGAHAVSDPSWEPYPMMWNGMIKLHNLRYRFFFSPVSAWRATHR